MFLTVGEKIRQVRQQFHLKQGIFTKFGITQHYLSMIETNKRKPAKQTLIDIYNALETITNGQISSLYTLEEFLKEPLQAVSEYIENQLDVETIENHYDELMNLAQKYELSEYIIKIDTVLGNYYFMINDYEKTTNHFTTAIKKAVDMNLNPYPLYHHLGVILKGLGRYVEAVATLCFAVGCAPDKLKLNDSKVHLMITYYRLEEYGILSRLIAWIENEREIHSTEHYVAAMILKEGFLRKTGQVLEARECLLPFIDKEEYEPSFQFIYHYLGWNYVESGEYDQAIKMFKKSLQYCHTNLQKAVTGLLIGHGYFEIKNYEIAQEYYSQVKSIILSSSSKSSKRMWFALQLNLYWHTKQVDRMALLLKEFNLMVESDEFLSNIAYQIKSGSFKQVASQICLTESQYSFLNDMLTI